MNKLFENEAASIKNSKWEQMNYRVEKLYRRKNDLRTNFDRDYTRIIHSMLIVD